MADLSVSPPRALAVWREGRVWIVTAGIFALAALAEPSGAAALAGFVLDALIGTGLFLAVSVLVAAYAAASGADALIARAFSGAPLRMVAGGALVGALSPFCSCGVIPLVAALLSMGVPLAPVMAFWLASPIMDPSMFALTTGVLGVEFAVAKTAAAIGIGLMGGVAVLLLARGGALSDPLRPGVGDGGCGASSVRAPKAIHWRPWEEPARRAKLIATTRGTGLFLLKWLLLAFLLEALMLRYLPEGLVAGVLGGDGVGATLLATAVGVPAYLNGYAALPLVGGLMEQGMGAGPALAFLVAGGVSSIPAALAVWALARPPVFALYLALAWGGAALAGLTWGLIA